MDQNKSNRQKMNKLIMTGVLAVLLALTGTVPAVAQDNVIDEVVWVVLRWHYPNQVMGLSQYLLSAKSSPFPLL